MNRLVPEALQVPARAILGAKEVSRWEACAERYKESVETTRSETDGLVLKLLRHPRPPDQEEHMKKCVKRLQDAVGVEAPEAEERLKADEKFFQFWCVLRTQERGSAEEASIARSLRARVRILSDAFLLAGRVSVSWEAAREGLEKVKWYRQLLGSVLGEDAAAAAEGGGEGGGGDAADSSEWGGAQIAECLDAV